jgi:phage-related protein
MKVVFYKKDSGREPVKENIFDLEKNEISEIFGILEDVENNGFNSTRCEFKQIEGKLWEIKIKLPRIGYRIFYTIIQIDIMILLHSYKKQSQKAPRKELDVAFKRFKDVINNGVENV